MEMTREEWLVERRKGIGGSDVHDVFSLEPYGCSRRLWYDKRGIEPDYARDDGGVLRRGTVLEAVVADEYAHVTGRPVAAQRGALAHPEHPELRVNIDRWIAWKPDAVLDGILEIKTVGRETYAKLKREGLPQGYILQLQHACLVTGAMWGAFAVLWPDQWKLLHWDMARDQEMQAMIQDGCTAWWRDYIVGTAEPERLEVKDKRCARCEYRTSCQGQALLEAAGDEPGEVPYDVALSDLTAQYMEMRDIRDEAEGQLDDLKGLIDKALAGRTVLDTEGARIYYRPQTSQRWDTKALEREHPELREKYKKPSVSRPLRIFAR